VHDRCDRRHRHRRHDAVLPATDLHPRTGRPDRPPNPATDGTRIFSSPVVVGDRILFGVDVDGQRGERGYAVAADLVTGNPRWEHQTDVDAAGRILNDGCGSIWSSGTVLPALGLVVFDTADCHFGNPPPTSESVIALRISDGRLQWQFRPRRVDIQCDRDFGGTPNAGITAGGRAIFLGVGSKDGTYYSLDPATGRLRWSTNVVFGGVSGGFVGTAAYDGHRVYSSTALGDYGRIVNRVPVLCQPGNPRDQSSQEPSVHAFDAASGRVVWQATHAASFGATTVAGGLLFNCPSFVDVLDVRVAATGRLVRAVPLADSCWSGVATAGDAVVLGTGSTAQGFPAGIVALTPGGGTPQAA